MIRKNDSETYLYKWGKTITPKLNWHISKNSIYTNKRIKNGKSQLQINLGKMYQDNWGNRSIGVHYTDNTNKYQRHVIRKYKAIKEMQKILKKRGITTTIWSIPEKMQFKSSEDIKKNYKLIKNLANKFGYEIIINWEYIDDFPALYLEKKNDVYYYPYL